MLRLREKPHGELPWLCKVERSEGRSCTQPKQRRPRPTCGSESPAGDSLCEQMDLGESWNHVVREGCVVKATTTPHTNLQPNSPF